MPKPREHHGQDMWRGEIGLSLPRLLKAWLRTNQRWVVSCFKRGTLSSLLRLLGQAEQPRHIPIGTKLYRLRQDFCVWQLGVAQLGGLFWPTLRRWLGERVFRPTGA